MAILMEGLQRREGVATAAQRSAATTASVAQWIEDHLTYPEGPTLGEPVSLQPFQLEFISGYLSHRISALSVARGNGKTTLLAALAAAESCGPLAIRRGRIFVVAASLKQGRTLWDHYTHFLREIFDASDFAGSSWHKPRVRIRSSMQEMMAEFADSDTRLQVLGSDPGKAHSIAPTAIIGDEPSQWKEGDGPRMHAALRTSLGKQLDARYCLIGTQPRSPDHFFARVLESPSADVYVQLHAPTAEDDLTSDGAIASANPLAVAHPVLWNQIASEREEALSTGGFALQSYTAYRLNTGGSDTVGATMIVDFDRWQSGCEVEELPRPDGEVYVGVDLGGSASMTAGALYWPASGRLEVVGAFPGEPGLLARGQRDNVGDRYEQMQAAGDLLTWPGQVTPVGDFLAYLRDRMGAATVPASVAADRYRRAELEDALRRAELEWPMRWRGMGAGPDGILGIRLFQRAVLEGRVKVRRSLLVRQSILDSEIGYNENMNPRLDRRRKKGRIDALVAMVHAVCEGMRVELQIAESDEGRKTGRVREYYEQGGSAEILVA